MSIWSSIDTGIEAADLHDGGRLAIDVATALSWRDDVRLALFSDELDVCAVLDVAAAETLRDSLDEAIRRVRGQR